MATLEEVLAESSTTEYTYVDGYEVNTKYVDENVVEISAAANLRAPVVKPTNDLTLLDFYAKKMLKSLNSIQHTLTYSHGYCPVRIGDCVRLNYKKAGITNVKAKVVTQGIECKSGCTVSETAVYTSNLWKE